MSMTVFVTGASAGFGAAITKKFVTEGHRVVAAGRRQERLKALADELKTDRIVPGSYSMYGIGPPSRPR